MKLYIKTPSSGLVVDLTDGNAVAMLSGAKPVAEQGYGSTRQLKPTDDTLCMELVPDSIMMAPTEPTKELAAENQRLSTRWVDEYNKRVALEKQLKELQEKLATISGTVGA